MFTGIIRHKGRVKRISKDAEMVVLEIESPEIAKTKNTGDSIAVDGTCLTITNKTPETFSVEVMPESMSKTIINNYKEDTQVNLENPTKMGDPLDGHFVSGHVDFVSEIKKVKSDQKSKTLTILTPEKYKKYIALKGSITINGVSLTVSELNMESFEVSLIPETLKTTNLEALKPEDHVNVEIDLIIRYLDSLMNQRETQVSYEFLKERGFL